MYDDDGFGCEGGLVIGFHWGQLNNILNIEHYFSISNFNYKVCF